MDTHWIFEGIDEADRERCKRYWEEKKARRIGRLLHRLPRPHRLSLGFEAVGKEGRGFRGRALLTMPTGNLVVTAQTPTLVELTDAVADKLVHRLHHHRDRLRAHWVDRRRARRREETEELPELLAADRAAERRESFYELLKPLLRPLERTIRLELDQLEKNGVFGPRQISVDDVRDEVLLRAWSGFENRPAGLQLDLWLMSLVERVLADLSEEPSRVQTLSQTEQEPEAPSESEEVLEESDEAWAHVIEEHDEPDLVDLLPATETASGVGELEVEELREEIERTLRTRLEAPQRRALISWLFEGLTAEEIALIQNRDIAAVEADIEKARNLLREHLAVQRT